MASSIKDFKYEEDDDDCDSEEITAEDLKKTSTSNSCSSKKEELEEDTGKVADDEEAVRVGLLNESMRSSSVDSSRRASVVSSASGASSVTPRANGRNSFKYKTCSICLTDFESGVKVKVLPVCGHTFHRECLEQWLVRQFRCPNCNKEISTGEPVPERSAS